MDVHPLPQGFGLEIRNIDLRATTPDTIHTLRSLLERHGLLIVRNQVLLDEDLARFSYQIGDGRLEESARRISHSPYCSYVANLTNLKDESGNPLGFAGSDTDYWHSDQEFREAPAILALLYCVIPSRVGGATSFVGLRANDLNLAPNLMQQLRSLQSTRRPASTHDNAVHVEVAHPVVLKTPLSGEEMIYISENTIRFLGLSDDESSQLKALLLERILQPGRIYSHQWCKGDLLLYDNTQLLHRREAFEGHRWLQATKIFAPTDYFAVPSGMIVDR